MTPLDNAHQLERRARTIVESLQGTWRRGKGMCCCPAHDDRTPSLSVTLGRKAILFHCFAGCPNEDVIAALDRQGVRSRDLFNGSDAGTIERQSHGDFSPNARRLWQSATAISDSPAARYLAQRGLLRASDQLRYLARTPLGPRGAVQFLPAMLSAVTTDIGIIAATLGNDRFALVSIPESVRELYLFIDNDAGGALAEQRARKAYAASKRLIYSQAPAAPGFDWNDELNSRPEEQTDSSGRGEGAFD